MRRVYIEPHFSAPDRGEGGIRRVVDALTRYLPEYGWEAVTSPDEADLIHNHGTSLAWRPGTPTVHTNHGLMWAGYNWDLWAHVVNRQVRESIMRADAHTCPSEWVRGALTRGMLIHPEVIPHGTALPKRLAKAEPYILWNKARADEVADPRMLADVAKLLPQRQFISTLGEKAANVSIVGVSPAGAAQKLIAKAGVYLSTCRETFGIGTLEALACGVPVAGFAWGGNLEIVQPGITGYLAQPGDFGALADCIERCIAERPRLSTNAREDAEERWRWPDKVARYAALFDRVMDGRAGRPSRVSVLITYHNLGAYLPTCIDSLLAQDYDDWEAILLDDASERDQSRLARAQAKRDPRIRYRRLKANLKLSLARNKAAELARGLYLLPLDADDMLAEGTLRSLAGALDADRGTHIAYGHLDVMDDDGGNRRRNAWPFDAYDWRGQLQHLNQLPYSAMMRREVLEWTGGYRRRDWRAEDAAMWCRVTSYGFRARKVMDGPALVYRLRSDSKSKGEPGDGDWTAWFPWRTASQRPSLPPWGAQGQPQAHPFWPVPARANPLVTVVIPVGPAHEGYLIDALDSVAGQTYDNWEVVVVNDTGRSWKAADQWGSPVHGVPWARVVESPRRGVSAARNAGAAVARGKLLVFLDADDVLLPLYMEMCLLAQDQSGGIVYTDWARTKPDPEAPNGQTLDFHQTEPFRCGAVLEHMQHAMTVLTPRKAWEDYPFDESFQGWEDWDWLIGVQAAGWCSVRVPETLFVYRFHSGELREQAFAQRGQILEAVRAKWGPYYTGEKRMGCGCEKNRANGASGVPVGALAQPAAISGSIPVEYVGGQESIRSWRGPRTARMYRFGAVDGNRVQLVDVRDLERFQGHRDFRIGAAV